ncbi:AAA family ATPase [Flavobacterium sp. FlaQc-57]|uniref:AAA family ATPase n=1 Tax=Flavobacterium sp. FlaQc-57 TaxID=3374186 RepID=UPI003757B5BD
MNLLSVNLVSDSFKSLKKFEKPIFFDESPLNTFDPICLVGLNGSGKSHFVELIAECFMLAEYYGLNKKFPSFENVPLLFEIEYSLNASERPIYIKISRPKANLIIKYRKDNIDEEYIEVSYDNNLLPKKIIGYSSGLNETLSSPFSQLLDDFSSKISSAANNDNLYHNIVEPIRMIYLESSTNLLLVITNLIYFQKESILTKYTKLKRLKSFKIEINKNIKVKVKTNAQLDGIIEDLVNCSFLPKINTEETLYTLNYTVNETLNVAVNNIFGKPMLFFDSLLMLNHLNYLGITKKYNNWIKNKRKEGHIIRTPTIPDDDRFFNITDIIFENIDGTEINYEGLSDGEHQLIQTLGTLNLIDEPDALFLYDEPDTHYNPEWRSHLFSEYSNLCKSRNQEIMVTTHSPFIVSSVRSNMVYHFERDRVPLIDKPTFETFGCSINVILKRLFKNSILIPQLPFDEMKELAQKDLSSILESIDNYGESSIKALLYKKINELE